MRMFPVLKSSVRLHPPSALASAPWDMVAPHERQADRNHGQMLRRLAKRSGLSPTE